MTVRSRDKVQVMVFLALFFLKDVMVDGGGVDGGAMDKNRRRCDDVHRQDCRPAHSDHGYKPPCKKGASGCKSGGNPPIHPRNEFNDAPSRGRGGDGNDGDNDVDETYKYSAVADGKTIVRDAYSVGY